MRKRRNLVTQHCGQLQYIGGKCVTLPYAFLKLSLSRTVSNKMDALSAMFLHEVPPLVPAKYLYFPAWPAIFSGSKPYWPYGIPASGKNAGIFAVSEGTNLCNVNTFGVEFWLSFQAG